MRSFVLWGRGEGYPGSNPESTPYYKDVTEKVSDFPKANFIM